MSPIKRGLVHPQNEPNKKKKKNIVHETTSDAPTNRGLVDPQNEPIKKKQKKKIVHETTSDAPTNRGLVDPQNEPNRRINHASFSSVVPDANCQDRETESCITSCGNVSPKENNNTSQVFPEDVEIEILLRLPVKSLVRSRCVSKSWYAIIKSPTFIKRHFTQHKKGSVLLIRRLVGPRGQEKNNDVFSFHNPDSPDLERLQRNLFIPHLLRDAFRCRYDGKKYDPTNAVVLGPCNGLVCINHFDRFILCNPALREFKLLPECPPAPPRCAVMLGVGFGRASNGDFNVVLVRPVCRDYKDPSSHHHVLIYVYNSRINAWKKVDFDSTVLPRNFYIPTSELFLNDACHWVAVDYNQAVEVFAEDFPKFILSFDINTEVIRRLELPQCLQTNNGHSQYLQLTNLNECLAVLRNSMDDRRFELWVMREYGVEKSWTTQFVVRQCLGYPLGLWKNGEWLLSHWKNRQLASFASDPGRMRRFQIYGRSMWALLYEESLLSVNELCSSEEGLVETGKKLKIESG